MIRNPIFLLLIISLFACGSDTKSGVTTPPKTPDAKPLQTAVPFAGNWVSEDYLNDINKHKSPRKAQETSEECFIQIPSHTLQPTNMAYNFHEAGPDLVVTRQNDSYQLWEQQNGNLVKAIYTVEVVSEDKIKLGDKTFVRIRSSVEKSGKGILENVLFEGKYVTNTGQTVVFKNNGEIMGLEKYKYFVPVLDYFDAGLQVDQVGLGETRGNMDYFGFKYKGDMLELYKLKCKTYDDTGNRCVDVGFGERLYQLKKISGD